MFFQGYLEKSGVFVGKVNKFPICILNFLVPRYPVKEEFFAAIQKGNQNVKFAE